MRASETIEDILTTRSVHFSLLRANSHSVSGCAVHAVQLHDHGGRLKALVPADCLLDLEALKRFCGRELLADDAAGSSPNIAMLVPVPPIGGDMPLIVDRGLLDRDFLVFPGSEDGMIVQIAREEFASLLSGMGAASGNFSIPLCEIATAGDSIDTDESEIVSAVSRFTSRRIQKRLEDTLDFPPLPEIAHRIIQLGADPNASMRDLASIVEIDPSLSAQVVSWASSPYYMAPGKISSIHDAIVRVLGYDLVMNLALGLALGKTLRLPREGRYGYREYWVQAVYCAAMMDGICKAMPSGIRPTLGHAYLCGLLHNFGFLILAELFKPQLQLVCRYCEANRHLGHEAIERHLLGVTREQVAGWLMRFWNLPDPICTALRFQSEPGFAMEHDTLTHAVHLSRRLLAARGIGSASPAPIPESMFERLGIAAEQANEVWERICASGDALKAMARDLAA